MEKMEITNWKSYDKQSLLSTAMRAAAVCLIFSALRGESAPDSLRATDSTHINKSSRVILTVLSQPSVLQRSLYYPTWWGYHASFIADFTLTGMILDRGGREGDPLYTLFGERNMAGVIGSAIAVHAFYSFISWTEMASYMVTQEERG